MRRQRSAIGIGLAAAVLSAGTGLRSAEPQTPSVQSALTAYERGARTLSLPPGMDSGTILKELDKLAPAFLANARLPEDRARRVLAAFALEAATAAFTGRDILGSRRLVEWGCAYVRRRADPTEFDRRWSLASIALLEGALDPGFLETHIAHLQPKFPNDAGIRLAWAIASEQKTAPMAAMRPATVEMSAIANADQRADDLRLRRVQDALSRFRALVDAADVQAEARVRLAHLSLDLDRNDDAVTWLADNEGRTKDPTIIYLTRLFRGLALDRLVQPAASRAALRAALDVGPGAHSASLALATVLFRMGDRDEAARLSDAILRADAGQFDPWWMYWMGDLRVFNERLTAMREALE